MTRLVTTQGLSHSYQHPCGPLISRSSFEWNAKNSGQNRAPSSPCRVCPTRQGRAARNPLATLRPARDSEQSISSHPAHLQRRCSTALIHHATTSHSRSRFAKCNKPSLCRPTRPIRISAPSGSLGFPTLIATSLVPRTIDINPAGRKRQYPFASLDDCTVEKINNNDRSEEPTPGHSSLPRAQGAR